MCFLLPAHLFLKGLVFFLEDLVDSRSAGVPARIVLSCWPLLFFGWPPVPRSLVAAVLLLIPHNLLLVSVISGDSFLFIGETRFSLGFVTFCT